MKFSTSSWSDALYFGLLFFEWEPWRFRIGLTFGPWIAQVEFKGAFTKGARERRRELKAQGKWDDFFKDDD